MGPNADCSFSPLPVLCTCHVSSCRIIKNNKEKQNQTFNHWSLQFQRFKPFRAALVVPTLLVCTEAQLNCKLVPVAGLATECLFTQMMTLSVFFASLWRRIHCFIYESCADHRGRLRPLPVAHLLLWQRRCLIPQNANISHITSYCTKLTLPSSLKMAQTYNSMCEARAYLPSFA